MKSSIITNETSSRHFVQNYRFKVLSTEHTNISHATTSKLEAQKDTPSETSSTQIQNEPSQVGVFETPDTSATPASSAQNDSFVEELLKKVDEMSDNVIKLQMQIENQEREFNTRLVSETERARAEGEEAGRSLASESFAAQLDELKRQYGLSIQKLDEESKRLDEFITKNEAELGNTAIEIAKEVIAKELLENSAKIALELARKLLSELAGASKIKLSVNPSDANFLKENFTDDTRISVVSDEAIAKGGIIITSDVKNIEASLSARLEKIKSMVG